VALVSVGLGVNGGHVVDSSARLCQLHVCLLLAAVGRVEKRASLFKLALEGVGLPVGKAKLLSNFLHWKI
jgi:hypothetical protein